MISKAKLRAGDCIKTRGTGWMSRLIIKMTSLHTKGAKFSHTACAISADYCIEALGKARINPINRYDSPDSILKVYRIPLTDDQRNKFRNGAFEIANKAYGWTKLPLFALDAIVTRVFSWFGRQSPVFFFTKYFGIFNIPVCSQLYVYILYKYCGYRLYDEKYEEVPWRIVSPDYLDDLMDLTVNRVKIVYEQG